MPELGEGERRLAAVMFTDIAGYTTHVQKDEARALRMLGENRKIIRPFLPKNHGRAKTMGDSFLVEFPSAMEAVKCAFDIQQSLHEMNLGRPTEQKVMLRIGSISAMLSTTRTTSMETQSTSRPESSRWPSLEEYV